MPVEMSVRAAFRDSDRLYATYTLRNAEKTYIALAMIFPEVQLVRFEEDIQNASEPSIDELTASMERLHRTKWKEGTASLPDIGDNRCEPLTGTISGSEFSDGQSRKFVRHLVRGQRITIGRHICDDWNQDSNQLRFYETFVPHRFSIGSAEIFVDPDYPGAAANAEFAYICQLDRQVEAKAITSPPQEQSVSMVNFFETHNALFSAAPTNPDRFKWEIQVLRNILEGQILWNNASATEE